MTSDDIQRIISEIEKEDSLFADKSYLDPIFSRPGQEVLLVGRQDKAAELARAIVGSEKHGYLPAFIFVYGRTGSGKSTVVNFVCKNLNLAHKVVNLRYSRTVFGCARLILSELGGNEDVNGFDSIIEEIGNAMGALAKDNRFVLVLDEFDALIGDKRSRPADFIYRLVAEQGKLREACKLVCVIAISNNPQVLDGLDDSVRSRIGLAPEILFDAYKKPEILEILKARAAKALSQPVDAEVLEYCAELSAMERGDARRAMDLLRVAAEIAGLRSDESLSKSQVDMAVKQLERDRAQVLLGRASYHQRGVCGALLRMTIHMQDTEDWSGGWYSTSTIYRQYCDKILRPEDTPLSYRWVSELLAEVESSGIVVSRTRSATRGYGKQYRLAVPPESLCASCFPGWLENLQKHKETFLDNIEHYRSITKDMNRPEQERRAFVNSARYSHNGCRTMANDTQELRVSRSFYYIVGITVKIILFLLIYVHHAYRVQSSTRWPRSLSLSCLSSARARMRI